MAPGAARTPPCRPSRSSPGAASPPAATPDLATDGKGDEVVSGTLALALTTPYTETRAGDVTRLRDGVITVTTRMSDPRVSGIGTWRVNADLFPAAGPRWGAYRLENADGAWDGTCSGAARDTSVDGAWSCRLTGSGAYDGYSYLFSATSAIRDRRRPRRHRSRPAPAALVLEEHDMQIPTRAMMSVALAGVLVAACGGAAAPRAPAADLAVDQAAAPTAATPAPTPEEITPPPSSPTPTPMPTTDGQGAEVVRGWRSSPGRSRVHDHQGR